MIQYKNMNVETFQGEDKNWLPEPELLSLSTKLIDLARERLKAKPEFITAMAEGRIVFEMNGIFFFMSYISKPDETELRLGKNKFPNKKGGPACESITILLGVENGLSPQKYGQFQYTEFEFDQSQSAILTCTHEAEAAIRKFIEENFPA